MRMRMGLRTVFVGMGVPAAGRNLVCIVFMIVMFVIVTVAVFV